MSREFCRDVPDPWGVQKVCAKKVRAHFSLPTNRRRRGSRTFWQALTLQPLLLFVKEARKTTKSKGFLFAEPFKSWKKRKKRRTKNARKLAKRENQGNLKKIGGSGGSGSRTAFACKCFTKSLKKGAPELVLDSLLASSRTSLSLVCRNYS